MELVDDSKLQHLFIYCVAISGNIDAVNNKFSSNRAIFFLIFVMVSISVIYGSRQNIQQNNTHGNDTGE